MFLFLIRRALNCTTKCINVFIFSEFYGVKCFLLTMMNNDFSAKYSPLCQQGFVDDQNPGQPNSYSLRSRKEYFQKNGVYSGQEVGFCGPLMTEMSTCKYASFSCYVFLIYLL